jgi:hypothetical protein
MRGPEFHHVVVSEIIWLTRSASDPASHGTENRVSSPSFHSPNLNQARAQANDLVHSSSHSSSIKESSARALPASKHSVLAAPTLRLADLRVARCMVGDVEYLSISSYRCLRGSSPSKWSSVEPAVPQSPTRALKVRCDEQLSSHVCYVTLGRLGAAETGWPGGADARCISRPLRPHRGPGPGGPASWGG